MQTLKKLKEIRKEQAVIIANVVYGFQGSDPAIQKKQIGVEVEEIGRASCRERV